MHSKAKLIRCLVILVLSMTACRAQNPVLPPVNAPAISVQITNDDCPSVEVQPGMQIMWTNMDKIDHTLIIERIDELGIEIDSGGTDLLQPGDSFSTSLSVIGQYTYYCSKDRTSFGTITVMPASYPYP